MNLITKNDDITFLRLESIILILIIATIFIINIPKESVIKLRHSSSTHYNMTFRIASIGIKNRGIPSHTHNIIRSTRTI